MSKRFESARSSDGSAGAFDSHVRANEQQLWTLRTRPPSERGQ
jgi:hypothetical protein